MTVRHICIELYAFLIHNEFRQIAPNAQCHLQHLAVFTQTLDGYCRTVQGLFSLKLLMGIVALQGLLDWFEVDLRFTDLLFIQIGLCIMCVFVLYSSVSLSSCPFLDVLHCHPRAVGVPLESALNLVSRMSMLQKKLLYVRYSRPCGCATADKQI